jgi:hypothetical protein
MSQSGPTKKNFIFEKSTGRFPALLELWFGGKRHPPKPAIMTPPAGVARANPCVVKESNSNCC